MATTWDSTGLDNRQPPLTSSRTWKHLLTHDPLHLARAGVQIEPLCMTTPTKGRGPATARSQKEKASLSCSASATSLWQENCHESLGIRSSISGLHSYGPDPPICDSPNCLQTLSDADKMFRKLLEAFNKTDSRTLLLACLPWLILQD